METEEELINFTSDSNSDSLSSVCSMGETEKSIELSKNVNGSPNDTICDSFDDDILTIANSYDDPLELHSTIESLESVEGNEQTGSEKEFDNILSENEVFSSLCDFESEPLQVSCSPISSIDRRTEIVDDDFIRKTEIDKDFIKRTEKVDDDCTMKNEIKNDDYTRKNEIIDNDLTKRFKTCESFDKKEQPNIEISGFFTGNNKQITITTVKQPKFVKGGVGRPARSFLKPEKGHKNTLKEEREKYIETLKKLALRFKKEEYQWLKIQFRWVWIHFNLNDLPLDEEEILKHINIRKSTEYSIIRRIIEGDDVSFRYMILLVIGTGDDYIEGYDGFYSVKIAVDSELQKEIKNKKLQIGTKIKLFGCKLLIESGQSIFDLKKGVFVMSAYYNGFSYASRTRKLGYKKKISFKRSINTIKKEGGPVSCLVGTVKKITEIKYVVQVKDYRNTVDDIEKEFENIMLLIEKYDEKLTEGDIKVRAYVRFILDDGFSECLITSWMYVDKIRVGDKIMFCNIEPVMKSISLHLTTTKMTYVKFLS
jgi:hypothetical protein